MTPTKITTGVASFSLAGHAVDIEVDAVEIDLSDDECLDPEGFLTADEDDVCEEYDRELIEHEDWLRSTEPRYVVPPKLDPDAIPF